MLNLMKFDEIPILNLLKTKKHAQIERVFK